MGGWDQRVCVLMCDTSYDEGVLVSDLGGMGTGPDGRDEVHMRRDAVL